MDTGKRARGQSVMFAVPGAYHNTQGQWQPKTEFGQAEAYLHIRGTDYDGGRGRRDKEKKEYRHVSEIEPGREGRMKTNRRFMQTGCCLSVHVMEKIIER